MTHNKKPEHLKKVKIYLTIGKDDKAFLLHHKLSASKLLRLHIASLRAMSEAFGATKK